jgi:ribonucleoside-diphosphate reductase alpha chain
MFLRVARNIATAEEAFDGIPDHWAKKYYDLMAGLKFLPNSPALMNAGKAVGQLAACFVLPVEDSMTGIFDTLKHAALILQSGGGTGFSFSRLRPKTDIVTSTGVWQAVLFLHVFNTATES